MFAAGSISDRSELDLMSAGSISGLSGLDLGSPFAHGFELGSIWERLDRSGIDAGATGSI